MSSEVPSKRPPLLEIPAPSLDKRQKNAVDGYQSQVQAIVGRTIPEQPWGAALQERRAAILPLDEIGCKRGESPTFFLQSAEKNIPPAIVKPAYFGRPGTVLWCPAEKIATIVSKMVKLRLPSTKLAMISSNYIPDSTYFPANYPTICSVHKFKFNMKNVHHCSDKEVKDILLTESPKLKKKIRKVAMGNILLANGDGGPHNLLVNQEGPPRKLTSIDHSIILDLSQSGKNFLLHAKACKEPLSQEEKEWIESLNFPQMKQTILRKLPGTPAESLRTLETTTEFLKAGARRNLTPYEMGCLTYKGTYQEHSFLEHCFNTAKQGETNFSDSIKQTLSTKVSQAATILTEHRAEPEPVFENPLTDDPRSAALIRITNEVNEN